MKESSAANEQRCPACGADRWKIAGPTATGMCECEVCGRVFSSRAASDAAKGHVPRYAAVKKLIAAVEAHLSAYSPTDEMAESDQDMADALALIREAERHA